VNTRLRALQKGEFRDPKPFLINLKNLEPQIAASGLDSRVKQLRTNKLKEWRETREAALFCYGMGQRIGQTVYLARGESQDFDFIASWVVGDEQHLAPVQLKEVVPKGLNPNASLQQMINSLTKYADSSDLTVAIHLNRIGRFDLCSVNVPPLGIAALWIFASITPDGSEWGLWGNFLEEPEGTRFVYPA
jgi:hypothetical protein